MNHSEAIQQMAAERYLLDDLSPDARDAFEEHMFDCSQCAVDVRAGAVFVDEAKIQLPELGTTSGPADKAAKPARKPSLWSAWWRPAFAAPVFAAFLIVVGYQNMVTIPTLRTVANQPRMVAIAPLYGATRGSAHVAITADRAHGIALPIDLPAEPGIGNFVSYSLDLYDPQGKLAWTGATPAPAQERAGDLQLSVVLPGTMLKTGTYTLAVSGIGPKGDRTTIERQAFDVILTK